MAHQPNDVGYSHALKGPRAEETLPREVCNVRTNKKFRQLLQHFLAALAYRTQKALRHAPLDAAPFRAAPTARTPFELVWHLTGLMGYARTMLHGGAFVPPALPTFEAEVNGFTRRWRRHAATLPIRR